MTLCLPRVSTEGIVVFDRNGGNHSGTDLFGDKNVTGRDVADGYADLALLDTNNDGVVDFNDEDFKNLQIWQDANSDGIAQEGELPTSSRTAFHHFPPSLPVAQLRAMPTSLPPQITKVQPNSTALSSRRTA